MKLKPFRTKGCRDGASSWEISTEGSLFVLLKNCPYAKPYHHPKHGFGWIAPRYLSSRPDKNLVLFQFEVPSLLVQEAMAVEQRRKLRREKHGKAKV